MKNYYVALIACITLACSQKKEQVMDNGVKPDDNRFTPVVVTREGTLNEPMVFQIPDNETAYIIERHGAVKKIDLATKAVRTLLKIPVFTDNEQGLVGFTLDPLFAQNHFVYLYYAHDKESKFLLTRWQLEGDTLKQETQKVMLEIPCDRGTTSHTGGGMTWDKHGNLYLTVGNNTGNSLYSQTDQRKGREQFDDQRGAANSNDLRGKILRIHPEPDGTYSIPDGNLFPKGTPHTRPEIYVMGNRNPWRIHVDTKTGFVYWGEIGPDADSDSERGPMGYDELNQARKPGFYGWPYFIGENQAYPIYDYSTNTPGLKQDPAKPVNISVNNTGIKDLPPAEPAFIAYPYRNSDKYPLVGSSSRCAIGGPVYRRADFKNPARPFPSYYEGKWLAADLSRFWIMAIEMNDNGDYVGMERFIPEYHPAQPIDIKFGPDGDLYVLEYGSNTANSATESRLVRIEYNAGNRKPVVVASADRKGAALPAKIHFSSDGTRDFDNDDLHYKWTLSQADGIVVKETEGRAFDYTFDKAGVYVAKLLVKDKAGATNNAEVKVIAGNEPPRVMLKMSGNHDFFFDGDIREYQTEIYDEEDGSIAGGEIKPAEVSFSIDYASAGFDYVDITLGHAKIDASTRFAVAETMMSRSDCRTCHHLNQKGVGPSFVEIQNKYKGRQGVEQYLAEKIRNGSFGVWGKETSMPAHPTISANDARTIAQFILNVNNSAPMKIAGSYVTKVPPDDMKGTYIFRAAYIDRTVNNLPSHAAESVWILRSPVLDAIDADDSENVIRDHLDEYTFMTARRDGYLVFRDIDMTQVNQVTLQANWHLYDIYKGGQVELRLDKPDGELLASTELLPQQFNMRYRGAFGGLDDPAKREKAKQMKLPFLDERKFFGPGSDKTSFTIPSVMTFDEQPGRHDLYLVFLNNEAKSEEALFPLSRIILGIKK